MYVGVVYLGPSLKVCGCGPAEASPEGTRVCCSIVYRVCLTPLGFARDNTIHLSTVHYLHLHNLKYVRHVPLTHKVSN